MRSTIVDIKNRTGLSLATISKYLNGGNVRPENKEKIDEAVRALHYRVNENARSLVTNQTKTIGVIVFSVGNTFVGQMLSHIGECIRKHGFSMLICDSDNDEELEKENMKRMIHRNVDGVIIMPVGRRDACTRYAKEAGIPVVTLDRKYDGSSCDSISVDNREASRNLTNILIRNGHRKIAFLGAGPEYTASERKAGFLHAMKRANYQVRPEYMPSKNLAIPSGYTGMKELMALPDRPTAVFLANYEIALGAIVAIHESAFSYPRDFSLVGFDNLYLSDIVVPRITLAVQPLEQMALSSARLILKRIEMQRRGELYQYEDLVFHTYIDENGLESVKRL